MESQLCWVPRRGMPWTRSCGQTECRPQTTSLAQRGHPAHSLSYSYSHSYCHSIKGCRRGRHVPLHPGVLLCVQQAAANVAVMVRQACTRHGVLVADDCIANARDKERERGSSRTARGGRLGGRGRANGRVRYGLIGDGRSTPYKYMNCVRAFAGSQAPAQIEALAARGLPILCDVQEARPWAEEDML